VTGWKGTTLTVLSAGAIRRGVTSVAGVFERATGSIVTMDFTSAPKVQQRVLADEVVDVVIASDSALDALAIEYKIAPQSRTLVGRSRMGVVMRKGATAPDLIDTARFRRALSEAEAIVYNEGSSGAYAATILERLGLREQMAGRIRVVANGAEMIEAITSNSGRVFGLAQVTNILDNVSKGVEVELAGVFPDEIQNVTTYEAAVSESSANPDAAAELVRVFASEDAKKLLAAAGLD
jgi:molybdate transport system substrate-binding protein